MDTSSVLVLFPEHVAFRRRRSTSAEVLSASVA